MDFVSQSLSVSCYFFQTVFFRTRPVRQRKTMRQSWSSTVEKHWLNSCWFLRLKKTSFIITWCNVVSEPDDLLSDDESSFRLLLYCMFLYRPLKAQQCCNCWPMFQSDVQVSPDQDQLTWLPDIVQLSEAENEWNKHGVCAACVEGMNSPPRYFQMCLKLRGQFNIHKLLEDAGITPSCERPYKVTTHTKISFISSFPSFLPQEREVWFQLKILLSHNLTLGCDHHHDTDWDTASSFKPKPSPTHHGHPCPPQVPFYYFPIDHQQPQQPCG
uniref:Uncharacterized protein n=1 Tax=Lates calcarifer TaxID=8187 RepID=A0A4W6FIJ4_LATCA